MKDNITINEIVEMKIRFEGDFYPYEDGNGNGIIIKLDSEGDGYKICADQCECYGECKINDDCGNGMECEDYKCVEGFGNRRETIVYKERKVASIIVGVPLALCVFGIFTSLYFAQEYAKGYFNEKCDNKCGEKGYLGTGSVRTKIVQKESWWNKKNLYHCKGQCQLHRHKFYMHLTKKWKDVDHAVKSRIGGWSPNAWYPDLSQKVMDYLFEQNIQNFKDDCESKFIEDEVVAETEEFAEVLFDLESKFHCFFLENTFNSDVDVSHFGELAFKYSSLFDMGIFSPCEMGYHECKIVARNVDFESS